MTARGSTGAAPAISSGPIAAFGLVGGAATFVHFLAVSLLVPLGADPLIANIAAFVAAFGVSFAGHERWTFPAAGRSRARALLRFFIVALMSFLANELGYDLLLRFTPLGYREALLIVLIVVGGPTFIASRHWAFADEPV